MATSCVASYSFFLCNSHSKAWFQNNHHLFSSQFSGLIIWVELSWDLWSYLGSVTYPRSEGQTGVGCPQLGELSQLHMSLILQWVSLGLFMWEKQGSKRVGMGKVY